MPEYDNTNRGAAYRRDNANPKAPQWSGKINVEGKDFEISAWEKTSKNGDVFLSLSVKEPWKKGVDSHNKAKGNGYQPQKVDNDEDIPF
jgi:uncharacterized protein (DUF736 family)